MSLHRAHKNEKNALSLACGSSNSVPQNSAAARELLGHPRGLVYIGGTELWERISFHGMLALLVLYMVDRLLRPGHIEHVFGFGEFRAALEWVTGHLSVQALAAQIFGLYVGLVYLTPIGGGALGDRLLGRRRAVMLGAILMTIGHGCMAFEQTFLIALLFLLLGAGLLRGNLASQLGALYAKDDPRLESGFQIYYVLLNGGAFVAPLITGVLAERYGWDYGFAFAGIGMLAGLFIYRAGRRYLPPDAPRRTTTQARPMGREDRRVVMILVLMLPVLTCFWIAQTQIWNTYNLWARDHVNLMVAGWKMPVPWLQSVDALGVLVFVPPMLRFWRWQRAHGAEPDDLGKLARGMVFFGIAVAWLAAAQLAIPVGGRVPLAWALVYHLSAAIGYVYFGPTAIAFYSRVAPAAVNAMMIGVYYLSIFAGSVISGRIGGLYERLSFASFWLIHAAVCCAGGLILVLLAPRLRRALHLI